MASLLRLRLGGVGGGIPAGALLYPLVYAATSRFGFSSSIQSLLVGTASPGIHRALYLRFLIPLPGIEYPSFPAVVVNHRLIPVAHPSETPCTSTELGTGLYVSSRV